MLQTTTHSSPQALPLHTALSTSTLLPDQYRIYIMVNTSHPDGHLHKHDHGDPSTFDQRHQATSVHHEATSSSPSGTGVASILHTGAIALPVGTLFGGDHTSAPNSTPDLNMPNDHGSTPADGDVVWFCSDCYDGPISGWQVVCVNCSHQRCSACREEETS